VDTVTHFVARKELAINSKGMQYLEPVSRRLSFHKSYYRKVNVTSFEGFVQIWMVLVGVKGSSGIHDCSSHYYIRNSSTCGRLVLRENLYYTSLDFVSDIAIFVLKSDVKLQLTN